MREEERLREQAQRRTSSFRRDRKWNSKKNKRSIQEIGGLYVRHWYFQAIIMEANQCFYDSFLLEVGVYVVQKSKDIVSQNDHHPFIMTFHINYIFMLILTIFNHLFNTLQ